MCGSNNSLVRVDHGLMNASAYKSLVGWILIEHSVHESSLFAVVSNPVLWDRDWSAPVTARKVVAVASSELQVFSHFAMNSASETNPRLLAPT